jgi:ribosomal protein S18 acetylase RimI-like enzyme
MPSSNITVRRAEPGDAPWLVRFNIAMAKETEGLDLDPDKIAAGVEGLFARPQFGFYVLAEVDGHVAGGLMITYEWSDWRNRIFWWVQSVYVLPQYRGRGVYRTLYERVKAMGAESGECCGIRLYVEHDNIAAQETYRKLGMAQSHYLMFEDATLP